MTDTGLAGLDPALVRATLLEAAEAAAVLTLAGFRTPLAVENKWQHGFDPVTAADRDAEAAIRRLVEERHPGHGVIGEEYGEDRPDAAFVWVIDPIDGTRAFIAGLPVWTTLIGLRFEGEPVLGSIGQPYVGELFIGHAGGARLMTQGSSRPLATRKGAALRNAIIATTDPEACFTPAELAAWHGLRAAARLARLGCDAYAYAMVAAGALDMVVEAGLKAWDIEAAIPVLAGAGGLVTDWRGATVGRQGGQVALAGDRALLEEVLPLLAPAALDGS
jgi:histidinol phosphatase-like enzyme (inositol monophosphatase family)